MVVAGPNGVGKSSLLAGLAEWKEAEGEVTASAPTLPCYLPPLRGLVPRELRHQDVGPRHSSMPTMLAALEGANVASRVTSVRVADDRDRTNQRSNRQDNVDVTSPAGVKYGLAEIELVRMKRIAGLVDERRRQRTALDVAALPDVFAPLREAVEWLFPHLLFSRVFVGEHDPIRCFLVRRDSAEERDVDLDWLSTPAQKFGDVFCSGSRSFAAHGELVEE